VAEAGVFELAGDFQEARVVAMETERTAEFFGLGAAEVGELHGEGEHLLLEEDDALGAFEDGAGHGVDLGVEAEIGAVGMFAAFDERRGDAAGDRTGADDGDGDGDVVETGGLDAGQRGHLGARLDLEDADGIGFLDALVDLGLVGREGVQLEGAAVFPAEALAVLEHGHHAEAEEIDLHEAEVFAVVLVPLDDAAVFHRGVFDGDDGVEAAGAEDHAAGVLAEVARQLFDLVAEREHRGEARMLGRETGDLELLG
jgi:hypothetical protein